VPESSSQDRSSPNGGSLTIIFLGRIVTRHDINNDMKFEWDEKKAAENLRKHRVSFDEAASAFRDPLSAKFDDPDHSEKEQRYLTI